jgi:hypothetical protein
MFLAPIRFDVAGWPVAGARRAASRGRPVTQAWQWPAGARPAFRLDGRSLVLGRGVVARQTGSNRFAATAAVRLADRHARPGMAVNGSEGNAVGVELRAERAVAWRSVEGHRAPVGQVTLEPGRPLGRANRIVLRVTVGRSVRLAIWSRDRWRPVGARQPVPRWAGGARIALSVRARGRTARFEPVVKRR